MSYFIEGLKKYAFFDGRATRKQYWFFFLWYSIFYIIAAVVDVLIGTSDTLGDHGLISGLYALAMLLPYLGLAIRRLHDINRSGFWILINLVPVLGTIYLLYLFAKKGDPGVNEYGAPVDYPVVHDSIEVKYERVDKEV